MERGWKFVEIPRKSTVLWGRNLANQSLTEAFHHLVKIRNMAAKLTAFGPKVNGTLKDFKKMLRFFIKITMDIDIFHNFPKYFLNLCIFSENRYLGR